MKRAYGFVAESWRVEHYSAELQRHEAALRMILSVASRCSCSFRQHKRVKDGVGGCWV